MRTALLALLVCYASTAWGQAYPARDNLSAPIQQISRNDMPQMAGYYAPPRVVAAAPAINPAPRVETPAYVPPPDGDYGHSIVSDIRQMNF